MAYTSYQPNPSNSVQAQTIKSIGDASPTNPRLHYTLNDNSQIAAVGVKVVPPGSVPAVNDYMVLTSTADGAPATLAVWKKAAFEAHYQAAGSQTVTVRNSAGGVTRPGLAVVGGVVTLAATDAIVANGTTFTLQKSDGTTSSGNATLNSPATATVAGGLVSAVKASA